MKVLYSYTPENSSDSSITITASSETTNFTTDNLKSIEPVKSWKSTSVSDEWVKFDFGSISTHADTLFLNRVNFANCQIQYSTDDSTYNTIKTITGMETDEITDENYVKQWIELGSISFRYIKIVISAQTPLFETSYFKIGNALFGKVSEIWTPKSGFKAEIMPKVSITEFTSGYISTVKRGRTRRQFTGTLDKISWTEYNKLKLTLNPIVIYNDFENSDLSHCYLVRAVKSYNRSHETYNTVTVSFTFEELV